MKICIHNNKDCRGRIEWEHAWIYAGRQIDESWAIVGVCTYHHRGNGLDKEFNQYKSLLKADIDEVCKQYPKKNWRIIFNYLKSKYEKTD